MSTITKKGTQKRGNVAIKQKKGQFYILAAIILSVYAMTLALPKNREIPQSSFSVLYENYLFEAPKVVNSALYNETGSAARLANFTDAYIQMAESFEPNFGIMYAYAHDGVISIRSRLKDNVNITLNTASFILKDNSTSINDTKSFTAYVNKRRYDFNLSQDVSIQALFISKNREGVKVFKG